jgi:bifunctional DNA-binding transcriptional regulator/antitoxin component of YhaV-PrlF toxin-antitoxin module
MGRSAIILSMASESRKPRQATTFRVAVRKGNQITLPSRAAALLAIREGDVVLLEISDGSATIRPVLRSYAGTAKGTYGDANRYVGRERADWE